MSRIEQIATKIYGHVLKLYPATFRADFGEEMQTVFRMALEEAAQAGDGTLLAIIGREIHDLPSSIIWEHQAERTRQRRLLALTDNPNAKQIRQARRLLQLSATPISLFLLFTLRGIFSPSYSGYPQAIPFLFFLFVASASMLIALRWERVGGIMTVAGGFGLGLFMAGYMYTLSSSEFSFVGVFLVGTLWTLPFVIFGMLFYKLGRYQRPAGLSAG